MCDPPKIGQDRDGDRLALLRQTVGSLFSTPSSEKESNLASVFMPNFINFQDTKRAQPHFGNFEIRGPGSQKCSEAVASTSTVGDVSAMTLPV